jgi:hypothetical protein
MRRCSWSAPARWRHRSAVRARPVRCHHVVGAFGASPGNARTIRLATRERCLCGLSWSLALVLFIDMGAIVLGTLLELTSELVERGAHRTSLATHAR